LIVEGRTIHVDLELTLCSLLGYKRTMRHHPIIAGLLQASNGIALLAGMVLALFTARRWLFLLAALGNDKVKPHPRQYVETKAHEWPQVLLIVPFRDEQLLLPGLLQRLERLVYPSDRLYMLLVDDGSKDDGPEIVNAWTNCGENRHQMRLDHNQGKAAALNAALARFPEIDLVAVYDADERPAPDALSLLVGPFDDERVAATNGRRKVSNPLASPIATYGTFENLVHQLVTMRAKERLQLAPAILGSNCVYRRSAVVDIGGFRPGALLEDSDLTLRLVRAGWSTRFVPEAVSSHDVPETIAGYWQQHTRWASGFRMVAEQQASSTLRARHLPFWLRAELMAFALGYLDRLALISLLGVASMRAVINGRLPGVLLATILSGLITPFFQVVAALHQAQGPSALWRRLFLLPLFLFLDMTMAFIGLVRRPTAWVGRETVPRDASASCG
jgi:cellulose synthase/poly-beta-1,6-N-acetylglucosamine synthase-like glycosyltransferase